MVASSIALLARQAFADGRVLRRTERYTIYALPPGWLDHLVLVLPNDGHDSIPDFSPSLLVPVVVEDRKGGLMVREAVPEEPGPARGSVASLPR